MANQFFVMSIWLVENYVFGSILYCMPKITTIGFGTSESPVAVLMMCQLTPESISDVPLRSVPPNDLWELSRFALDVLLYF